MRIAILGTGYVGCVSAACLAQMGHSVIGVDTNAAKVHLLAEGRSPIVEPGLDALITEQVCEGRLRATTSAEEAVTDADLSIICVGTPSQTNGRINLEVLRRVGEELGAALCKSGRPDHVVVLRSTVPPGTTRTLLTPTLEATSGWRCGEQFHVAYQPEFLREGQAIDDFFHPPKIVVGADDPEVAAWVLSLYRDIDAPRFTPRPEPAEMIKYVDNAFHALKVAFANEMGLLCRAHEIDSQEVMEMFAADRKFNIAPSYLRPGFAFGGSCLPKDLRALTAIARERLLELPVLSAILPSNTAMIERAVRLVTESTCRRIGVLGLTTPAAFV